MQKSESPGEDIARKLTGVTHILQCLADEATGAARAEIDVARSILDRVAQETRDINHVVIAPNLAASDGQGRIILPLPYPTRTVTRSFPMREFSNVEIDCAFVFDISAAESFSVAITADESVFDFISVSRSGNTLKLSHRPLGDANPRIEARITMPLITRLRQGAASTGRLIGFSSPGQLELFVSGASQTEIDVITGDSRLEISGSSRVTGNLQAGSLDLVLSGAGAGTLRGLAGNLTLSAWGAANIDLTDFTAGDATVYLKGASQAVVNVNGRLEVELTGASRLQYLGRPTLAGTNLSGASVLSPVPELP